MSITFYGDSATIPLYMIASRRLEDIPVPKKTAYSFFNPSKKNNEKEQEISFANERELERIVENYNSCTLDNLEDNSFFTIFDDDHVRHGLLQEHMCQDLEKLPGDNIEVINGALVPWGNGDTGVIDHIVISPRGIATIVTLQLSHPLHLTDSGYVDRMQVSWHEVSEAINSSQALSITPDVIVINILTPAGQTSLIPRGFINHISKQLEEIDVPVMIVDHSEVIPILSKLNSPNEIDAERFFTQSNIAVLHPYR